MKSILVTGASGYLGSQLLKQLSHSSTFDEVIGLKRNTSSLARLDDASERIKLYNVENIHDVFKEHNVECIIHTATSYGRKQESSLAIMEANLLFPLQLLEAYFQANNKDKCSALKFINIDTILPKETNQYSLSKKQFLEWLRFFAKKELLNVNNIALHYMYGPYDEPTKFTSYIIQQCLNNVASINLSHGLQRKDFIHIDDIVSAIIAIMQNHQTASFEEFELGTGTFWSIRDYATTVHDLLNSTSKLNFGAIPSRNNEQDGMAANITKLKKLGWQPKYDLSSGLSATIKRELEQT